MLLNTQTKSLRVLLNHMAAFESKAGRILASVTLFGGVLFQGACSLGLTEVPDPSGIVDPALIESRDGAIAMYHNGVRSFARVYAGGSDFGYRESFVAAVGLGSDEFSTTGLNAFALRKLGIDGIPQSAGAATQELPWYMLHSTRLQVDQTIGGLKKYGGESNSHRLAEMYALRGYISVMIGEAYCSGVPFSRAIYGGDIEYGRPISTVQVFEQAIADFDSALAVTTDSSRFHVLARIGKARSLLNLNMHAAAAQTVSSVPDNFVFDITFGTGSTLNMTASSDFRMANGLGINGLNYISAGNAGDPRVKSYSGGMMSLPIPSKISSQSAPIPLANGIEARLIEAEALLREDKLDQWADALNALRRSFATDTITALKKDSTTEASKELRENVMFRERAFWLYATGHRMGDMRRIVRQYNRPVQAVFPVGMHPLLVTSDNTFSLFPNFAPPVDEVKQNPYYDGCFHREA